mmetsp:Transcript_16387/g.24446  ORF Transcript_16387/g.24446 Transcript_16387/m.24446 type:complete len:1229 (-) Transcript_16387:30-3716(-)
MSDSSDVDSKNIDPSKEVVDPSKEVSRSGSSSGSSTDVELGEAQYEGMKPKTFRWVIPDYLKMKEENNDRETSPIFEIGNCKWQLLLFPNGNGIARERGELSLYLEVAERDELPKGWRRDARIWLHVVNQVDESKSVRQETQCVFSEDLVDFGFPQIIPLKKLIDPEEGFVVDGQLILEVELMLFRVWIDYRALNALNFNSRAHTGYVGLYNQGATCYLNAWLQALFHIGAFRRAVYEMPTDDHDVTKSIPLALQRLFYRLQFREGASNTKELTKSFGWTSADTSTQHDVHELNCKLLENLENTMKEAASSSSAKNGKQPTDPSAIERLFKGDLVNYVECVNVDFRSEREDSFYDIGLQVKGCKDLHESFEKFFESELLSGDNQYNAGEKHGYQDARKGCRITRFPPVLLLQLHRWELSFETFQLHKVNDRYAFSPILDVSQYLPKDSKDSGIYHLHAILVHTGGMGGGHYYAYARPSTAPSWYLFDDCHVTESTEKEAIEDNWGGVEERTYRRFGQAFTWHHERSANAYMLVYVRETEAHLFMNDTGATAIGKHLHAVAEEHLYINLPVAVDADLFAHESTRFNLVSTKKVRRVRIKYTKSIVELKEQFAKVLGIPVVHQRIWFWSRREAGTLRPHHSIELIDQLEPFESFMNHTSLLRFFYVEDTSKTLKSFNLSHHVSQLDVAPPLPALLKNSNAYQEDIITSDAELSANPTIDSDKLVKLFPQPPVLNNAPDCQSSLIFFKFYDPVSKSLHYVGKALCDRFATIQSQFGATACVLLSIAASKQQTDSVPNSSDANSSDAVVSQQNDSSDSDDVVSKQNDSSDSSSAADVAKKPLPQLDPVKDANELIFFEEITPKNVESIDINRTLDECNLQSGDIIVFQKALTPEEVQQCSPIAYAPHFYHYIRNRVTILFRPLKDHKNADKEIVLELSKKFSYAQVQETLAPHIDAEPDKIRFTSFNPYFKTPNDHPCETTNTLKEMLPWGETKLLVFYEVFTMPIHLLETMTPVKIEFQNPSTVVVHSETVYVPPDGIVQDVLDQLKILLPDTVLVHKTGQFRMYTVIASKVNEVIEPHTSVFNLHAYSYIVEEIAPNELEHLPGDMLVPIVHFEKSTFSNFSNVLTWGSPFVLVARENETFGEFVERIRTKLGISADDFESWEVIYFSYDQLKEVDPQMLMQNLDFQNHQSQWIGLQHEDTSTFGDSDDSDDSGWPSSPDHNHGISFGGH